jgi:regulator of protease activity HflC (stomatin/prohibitin superfamily)
MSDYRKQATIEQPITTFNGIFMLLVALVLVAVIVFFGLARAVIPIVGASVLLVLVAGGFFMLQPNEAAAVMLFGDYRGTDRNAGLRWYWPWYSRRKVSLRARNLNGDKLKVNDKRGNPIEIAAVVVWRVEDTAQALFDVEDFENYIRLQAESAVRHLASNYNYDEGEEEGHVKEITLRAGADTVAEALQVELLERISLAGLTIIEAKLTHLAYAPEIAGAMLRRQQAEAVISARSKIVIGAVSMVEMALKSLSEKNVVDLDDERRAAMVSNLMVVLCSERDTQPIVNTGTLYN